MAENPFKDLESSEKAPESLKRALVSEIDTIRNTSIIIDLFVGNFINTITASLNTQRGDSTITPKDEL
ncbi:MULTISPECIES: hypothetical protein [Flectobacillus]|jgi:hypothetical protein|uniref:Uncharacterized protein n=1 Tax=Flectobacillus roseus TaxID=502259 RepID=A0ABT6YBS0_9BACT|nr:MULTISPECIES: hypothetical protein [Flectobacillus]MDI9861021.1 hypothetical protein [Flectobacillus roseus]MDI9870208.1 hypothetical protein [Flectobacillus roseus]NBA76607.1 hypothetical protein [Emticicia sp. ODNR4P]PAC32044.1 hypothetical protein BWI92_06710 [Flectobacillus sp. BAB-3569]